MNPEIERTLQTVCEAFKSVRGFVLEHAGDSESITIKTDGSPVTPIDVETEERIKTFLAGKTNGVPVMGEEGGYDNNLPESVWLIDPIDGTKSYVKNEPAFTGMGVLIVDGQILASVIYDYSTDSMFSAIKGSGAYKNDQKILLHDITLPSSIRTKAKFVNALSIILKDTRLKIDEAPSGAGYDFICVADGTAAARFMLEAGGYIHDYAPGALLISEAGGDIIPILEDSYTYRTRSFIACHPDLTPVIRQHIEEIRALENPANTAL